MKIYRQILIISNFFVKSAAFTLAEVLIVLGIIGVVAEMTIPTLMHNFQDQVYKTAYKKAYTIASQAWLSASTDGNILDRPVADPTTDTTNFNAFKSYFKIVKDCAPGNISSCWPSGEMYYGGHPSSDSPSFIDAGGFSWAGCVHCGGAELFVDTNGFKKPNKWGQDRFMLFTETSDNQITGTLIKVVPGDDVTTYNVNVCSSAPAHPCYYKSWIIGAY